MSLRTGFGIWLVVATICCAVGCRSPHRASIGHERVKVCDSVPSARPTGERTQLEEESSIQPVSHQDDSNVVPQNAIDGQDLFVNAAELSVDQLIAAVHARNPSMQAAQAAWCAAAERYPQAIALDDPILQSMFAPASFASNKSQSSYYLGAAQRIPWHGKRELKGQMALWEAAAASWDTQEVRLRLDVATRLAFFDYYLVRRELELNRRNVDIMQDFRSTAKSKYEANQVSQQDLAAADLQLGKLERQRLELMQAERTAVARINTLLHRRPDHSLPNPPQRLTIVGEVPDSAELREMAIQSRPELSALAARIQSEQNALALACKEYYPDFEFMGRYDSFWTDAQQRPQVGMNMNVPIRRDKLAAGVREAQFRVIKLNAEYAQQKDTVNEQVEVAYARVESNAKTAALYESTLLPAADTYLESGRAAYVAGSIDFLSLMEAVRQFIDQQIDYQRTLTEYHRSLADLERAVGTSLETAGSTELPRPVDGNE